MKKLLVLALSLLIALSVLFVPTVNVSASSPATEQKADDIIATATSLIGQATYNRYTYTPTAPYQFGCSGFIYYVFLQNGIDLATRDTQLQARLGEPVTKDQLQKGDIVFFDLVKTDAYPVSHDGIYIGDNKIIHMADSRNNIIISDLDSKAYYRDNYAMARRVLPSYMPEATPIAYAVLGFAESLIGKTHYGNYNESTLTFGSAGFVYYVLKQQGIDAKSIYASEQVKLGVYVPKDQLQRGDLVFFSNSTSGGKAVLTGIYLGNNQVLYNASSKLGVIKAFMMTSFYTVNYVTARRVY